VAVSPPGEEVTTNAVIGEPPFADGAAQVTFTVPSPAIAAWTPLGAPGTVAGVTAAEGAEAGPVPAALLAWTVKVYEVPLVRPATTALVLAPFTVAVRPPGLEVTVYDETGLKPVASGGVQLTVAAASPSIAVTAVGASGGAAATTAFDGAEAGPVPTRLVAVTVKV